MIKGHYNSAFGQAMNSAVILLLASLFLSPVYAMTDKSLIQKRYLFEQAEKALKRGQLTRYHKLEKDLQDYALRPYLKYNELKRKLYKAKPEEVQAFLVEYADTPLAMRMHHRWLKTLARQGRWQLLVDNFYLSKDRKLMCHYAHALYKIKQHERAHIITEDLWLTGRSLPRACNAPIKQWRESGKLTDELLWKRIRLAIQSGRTKLARYLAKSLPEKERFWVSIWSKVRRDPGYLKKVNSHFSDTNQPVLRWITVYGLTRLARKDAISAAEYWQELNQSYAFTEKERERIVRRLALALTNAKSDEARNWLKKLNLNKQDSYVQSLHILSSIRDQEWDTALEWLNQLPADEQHSERWRYWRGRVLEAMGRLEEARSVYLLNADTRSYYSFLAADRAGNSYHFAHKPLVFSNGDLDSLKNEPSLLRAGELLAIKRMADARREWNFATQNMSKNQLLMAAKLADEWGWHDRAIITLAQAKYWDDLEVRFPLAHQKMVLSQAQRQQINPAWAFAVIRQESAFTADARSHAGAMGLMQLLPRTARNMARSLRIRMRGRNDLLNINTNIKLGVRYLRKVQDRYSGHPVLATASYNAGPTNVRRWLPEEGSSVPADLWIENVPFKETRDYLKRVLTYTVIYEQRLGQTPVPLLERMTPIVDRATLKKQPTRLAQGS